MTEKAKKDRSFFAVMKQAAEATRAMIQGGASEKEMTNYAALARKKWQEKIGEYLEENLYNRTVWGQMIAAIRTGNVSAFHVMV